MISGFRGGGHRVERGDVGIELGLLDRAVAVGVEGLELLELRRSRGFAALDLVPDNCREFRHFADALSPSRLAHLLEVEGGAAE